MRRSALTGGALAAIALLAGCAGTPGADPSAQLPDDALGRWVSTENPEVHLEITDDGAFNGHDGCNGFGGEYSVASDALELDPGFSTLIACPDVNTWLSTSVRLTVSGDLLEAYDAQGKRVGTLTRA